MADANLVRSSLLVVCMVFCVSLCYATDLKACGFDAIYQFGDSLSDVGNSIIEIPKAWHSGLPYGMTIGRATGRSSDGLLMIDYIAQAANLSLLEPSLKSDSAFKSGANFAVSGVTALPADELAQWGLSVLWTNSSLNVQLKWFDEHLKKHVCQNPDECKQKLKSALFMVGSIGSNDYNAALLLAENPLPMDKVKSEMVPAVVQNIKDAVVKLIEYGATRLVVPGTYPMGCSPSYQAKYVNQTVDRDQYTCVKAVDDFLQYHHEKLRGAVNELTQQYPNVHIMFSDIYGAYQSLLQKQSSLGFKFVTKACCGEGNDYNASGKVDELCGAPNVSHCTDPNHYVFWDGAHPTQETNKDITNNWLIPEMVSQLKCGA